MTTGRELPPTSAFAGDDGAVHPDLARALGRCSDHAAGVRGAPVADVVAALATGRVLVPVLARAASGGTETDRPDADADAGAASAGIVALRTPDGRTALPVFSGTDALAAWRDDARPVPAEAARAAAAALQEGWDVMVLDPGGPVTVEIPHPAVRALAAGLSWIPAVVDGVVRKDVRAAVRARLAGVDHVVRVDAEPGRRAEVAVVLALLPGLGRARLDAVLGEVGRRLAEDEAVTVLVDSLEVRVVTADGAAAPTRVP